MIEYIEKEKAIMNPHRYNLEGEVMNKYHLEFDYFGEHYSMDAIAYDHGVTYPDCLTIYTRPAFRIVCNLFNISNLKIEPIK